MSTRRKFLLDCSTLAVTATVVPAVSWGAPRKRMVPEVALEEIAGADFVSLLNTEFQVSRKATPPARLELVQVKALESRAVPGRVAEDESNEKFSLLFAGRRDDVLEQGTYGFAHSAIGEFAMFIAPVGPGDDRYSYYEALFNRPRPQPVKPGRRRGQEH